MLLDPDQHRPLLDDFAALDTGPMRSAWELLLSARAALSRLSFASNNLAERELFLRYQLQELESLAFEAGEEEALGRERELLRHAVELREAARGAESELYSEENSALDRLSRARSLLERVSHLEPAHLERVGRLTAVIAEVEELGRELQVGSQSAPNPRRLDAVEERLAEIARLGRKHGCEAPQLLGVYERLQVELDGLGDVEAQQARAQAAMELAERNAVHEGERLHEQRVKAAKRLDGLLRTELERLAMPHACVRTHVERKELGPHGFCEVELRLSANLGEPPRALHRVASGGELSRVLFALRLQVGCPDATLVFDEIDTGIGGRTAEEVGARVATLARERQLLCISHLPQIASLADAHFVVRKAVRGGRTFSTIRVLNEAGRIEEVARMIGGSTLERATRDYARRLIRAYARVA